MNPPLTNTEDAMQSSTRDMIRCSGCGRQRLSGQPIPMAYIIRDRREWLALFFDFLLPEMARGQMVYQCLEWKNLGLFHNVPITMTDELAKEFKT